MNQIVDASDNLVPGLLYLLDFRYRFRTFRLLRVRIQPQEAASLPLEGTIITMEVREESLSQRALPAPNRLLEAT